MQDRNYVANAFDNYFVNIGPILASQMPDISINHINCMSRQDSL